MMKKCRDTITIAERCLLLSSRNPDIFLTGIILPALMMALFVALFGKLVQIEGEHYVNYIVPGILLQCIGQCSSVTAIMVNRDITAGMVSRYFTMPVKQSAVLKGHVLAAFVRNSVTSIVVLLAAMLLGFRLKANLTDWCVILVLLSGTILALSWAAVFVGIKAKSAEGASALSAFVIVLPYLSSGFVPVDSLPKVLRTFAQYQPMTPIMDSMRAAFAGESFAMETFLEGVFWCIILGTVFFFASNRAVRKRISGN